ncbi:type II secretion system protein [Candidatus Saccharibacteria bacterium]|nr:type II secretion system protein [Candidatus Saccharibacteria bacterium]
MKTRKGFTVLELILAIIFVGIFVVLFFLQKQSVEAMRRDENRKTSINAIYYALEEGYYADNGYYPENIENSEILPWIDPNLFTDPYGMNLWDDGSDFSYETSDCQDGKCKAYTLRTTLEKEDDYIKTSRN